MCVCVCVCVCVGVCVTSTKILRRITWNDNVVGRDEVFVRVQKKESWVEGDTKKEAGTKISVELEEEVGEVDC